MKQAFKLKRASNQSHEVSLAAMIVPICSRTWVALTAVLIMVVLISEAIAVVADKWHF